MSAPPRDAVLPVDKPEGPTSHDVVAQTRKALGERRIGHTGTLDPFATGLLLLCVGKATRLSQYLTGMDKTYEATARLGVTTDSGDRDGGVVATHEGWREITAVRLDEGLMRLRGEIQQVPPRFSAKKIDGEAAHRRARRGEHVELAPVAVTLHELTVMAFDLPDVHLRIRCSSGTYIRSLARDLGEALGVGAHLTALRRTAVGDFDVARALPPQALFDEARVASAWISPLDALGHFPRVEVDEEMAVVLGHGGKVPAGRMDVKGPAIAARAGELVAVGTIEDGWFRPRKVLFP